MRKLFLSLLMGTGALAASAQVTVSVNGGPATSYGSLNAAVVAVNALPASSGSVDIRIHSNLTETAVSTINQVTGNTVSLRPADSATVVKTVTANLTTGPILALSANGATIDGRAGGSGSTIRLVFNNTGNNALSRGMTIASGQNNTVQYVQCQTLGNFGATNSSTAAQTGTTPSGNTWDNCVFYGGQRGFDNTVACTNLNITNCTFVDSRVRFFQVTGGVSGTLNFNDNTIFHSVSGFFQATGRVLSLDANPAGATYNFLRNEIFGIYQAATNGGKSMMALGAAPGAGYTLNLTNNMWSFGDADLAAAANGFTTNGQQGANAWNLNLRFNTIRIGGSTTTTTVATALGRGFNVGSNVNMIVKSFNNLLASSRTFANASNDCALLIFSPVNAATDMNYNTVFSSPWSALVPSGVITSSQAGFRTEWAPRESQSYFATTSYVGAYDARIAPAAYGQLELAGSPSGGVTTDIDGNTRDASFPYRGAFEGTAFPTNDAGIRIIHMMGKAPQGTSQQYKVTVKNFRVDARTNDTVFITVSGANSLVDTQVIASLAAGQEAVVTSAALNLTAQGLNTITATLKPDGNNGNNSATVYQKVSANSFNYAYNNSLGNVLPNNGGVGAGITGSCVAKFVTPGANTINQLKVDFTTGGLDYRAEIYSIAPAPSPNDTPLTLLWQSATMTSVAGQATIPVSPTVAVSGPFFVGVRTMTAGGLDFAYQTENPIRTGVFYFRNGATQPWNDFGVNPNNTFRFMIEPRFQLPNDIGATALVSPANGNCFSASQTVTVAVENLGTSAIDLSLNPLTVNGSVSGTNAQTFSPVTVTTDGLDGILSPGEVVNVDLSTNYNMSGAGTYTFNASATFGLDINTENDAFASPVNINAYASTSLPRNVDFTGYNGANLGTLFPGFREAFGPTAAVAGSAWTNGSISGNTTARVNLNNNTTREWIVSPSFVATATTAYKFDFAVTTHNGSAAATMGADDHLYVMVSTNCGGTWTPVLDLTAGSNTLQNQFVDLAAYVGQTVTVGLFATDGLVDDVNDYDVHVDNISIYNVPATEVGVSAIVSPNSGCGLTNSETVTITVKNFGAPLPSGTVIPVGYSWAGGPYVNETLTLGATLGTNTTVNYTFATGLNLSMPGTGILRARTAMVGDPISSNNRFDKTISSQVTVNSFPYYEDFEGNAHGWEAGGILSSWALGTPAKSVINSAGSGVRSWVTNLTGQYNANERSSVTSPCMDFTSFVTAPYIGMKVWWNSERDWDGAQLQYSIDGGTTWTRVGNFNDPNNWYNHNVSSDAGVTAFLNGAQWWSGRNTTNNGSGGWRVAFNQLPAAVLGQSNVKIRVIFGADDSVQDDGFAFDGVYITESLPGGTQVQTADCARTNFAIFPLRQLSTFTLLDAVAGATAYEVQFSTSNVFTTIAGSRVQPGRTVIFGQVPGLNWGTTYFVRARAYVNNVYGPWGTVCNIGFVANPGINGVPATRLADHSCGRTNLTNSNSILANEVQGATSYTFRIYSDSACTSLYASITRTARNLPVSAIVPGLAAATNYWVRVYATIANVNGVEDSICKIATVGAPPRGGDFNFNQSDVFAINAWPNPFLGNATLIINSSSNEAVNVRITDVMGRVVNNARMAVNTPIEVGNDLSAGTYFVEAINNSGERATFKIVKVGK